MADTSLHVWHTSSYSQNGGQCVEVREGPAGTDVRDSQHREATTLTFPTTEWSALLRGSHRPGPEATL
ncbi:DUF397 domain-containing protein [Nocardiopsis sp. HNM0947]|uniref:DUF397 domain-containing protein n=1 Tax=Nocardiopsis coralli TaxID=2772213 RepID=A0ABR9P6Q5_9ACTN|nr:DUF397 domain-containing protein [Nocardiopsis coralli]MBE2999535.1 DUF397 domain-containing protein [Nocardiopsis coralli]